MTTTTDNSTFAQVYRALILRLKGSRLMLLLVLPLCLLAVSSAQAQIYKWKDEHGKYHYGDKAKSKNTKDAETVTIKDKYSVPMVDKLTPQKYQSKEVSRTVAFSDILLTLPENREGRKLIGRVTCGKPIDLYWTKGYVRFERKYIGPRFVDVLEEHGYTARVGDAVREAGDLSLSAKIKRVFINTCRQKRNQKSTQDSTYLKLEWTLSDPLKKETKLVFTTEGSHHGQNLQPSTDSRGASFIAAFDMAVNNALAHEEFISMIGQTLDTEIEVLESDKIKLSLHFDNNSGSFSQRAESLKRRTVIVKTENGHGSGVFIADDGYVLTNAHVVGEETEFSIRSGAGNFPAKLIRKNDHRDVAILKIDNHRNYSPEPVSISNNEVGIGEELYVIGTPLDMKFSHTITRGIVSAKRNMRGLPYIQTDAAINFGNSGGPVFNKNGDLIAISVSSVMTRDGASLNINYLIPIDSALKRLNVNAKEQSNDILAPSKKLIENVRRTSTWDHIYQWLNEPIF